MKAAQELTVALAVLEVTMQPPEGASEAAVPFLPEHAYVRREPPSRPAASCPRQKDSALSDCTASSNSHRGHLSRRTKIAAPERRKKLMNFPEINLFLLQTCSPAALLLLARRQQRISPAGVSSGPRGRSQTPPTLSVTRAEFVKVLSQMSTKAGGTTWCTPSKD